MKILGIDPGIGRMGWGILTVDGTDMKAQDFGCVETSSKEETSDRLHTIYTFLSNLIKKEKPAAVVVEELFFGANAKTALIVGHARGVILLCAGKHSVPVFEYTPLQVKMALTGYGRAEKGQIGKMVKIILKLSEIPKPDDTSDALAVAVTHASQNKKLS